MQYLIDQAAADLRDARQHLVESTKEYRYAKMVLGHCNRFKVSRRVKSAAMRNINKTRVQLRKDIIAAQNALDWYRSVKLGLLAEYRQTL